MGQVLFSTKSSAGPANKLEPLSTCTTCWEKPRGTLEVLRDRMKFWNLIGTTKKIPDSISATIFASELHEEQDHVCPKETVILLK